MQPLDYFIWEIRISNASPHPILLDDHVAMGPFRGKYFTVDVATVHKNIINYVMETTLLMPIWKS